MKYSLYELYEQSEMDLYDVRRHYIDHFYYRNHSKKDVMKVLETVAKSTKIGKLIHKSSIRRTMPSCDDLLNTISSMLRFWLRSDETQILAVMNAALRWQIEINNEMGIATLEELKKETLRIFKRYPMHVESLEGDFSEVSAVSVLDSKGDALQLDKPTGKFKMKTWSLEAFIQDHGEMQIGEFENKKTGETFSSCVFVKGSTKVFVAFSSKLGTLTSEEIEEMKDKLVIVQLPSGKYSLAKPKKTPWKKVDI